MIKQLCSSRNISDPRELSHQRRKASFATQTSDSAGTTNGLRYSRVKERVRLRLVDESLAVRVEME